ncbi:protease complex subunit PrcB family protein [Fervidobacterium pennivorans subsp. shakshaketiis]|uniref:protease complex subunit PrcB family protein n=1 Tax=Fervidobacterium pennivorans TaxID=93466 RepID=UPI001436B37C|nr:protease complex subunit PrcB family protein [Fervidobacterium pennivorans]QIV78747.1 protease complex subunit PrcB family protein [Fervidobacterium pennivorans subsp. keratinolyticus]
MKTKARVKNVYLLTILAITLVFSVFSFAQGTELFVKKLNTTLPEYLFKSVGTRTFSVQYIKLFEDDESKGYILKAWLFQPLTTQQTNTSFKIRAISPDGKKEFTEEIAGTRDRSYIRLPLILVILPAKYTLYVNSQVVEQPKPTTGGEVSVPIYGDKESANIKLLVRTQTGYRAIAEGEEVSKDDVIFLQVIAGTFPTGGYRIELNEPDIVYPVGKNPGKITVTGTFYKPGPGDMVTQAFTTPTKTIELGKFPAGMYEVIVDIKNLGEFRTIFNVK